MGDVLVTTTNAVAAGLGSSGSKRNRTILALCAAMAAAAVAGCGSTNFLGSSDPPAVAAGPATLPTQKPAVAQSRIALAPIMGAPDALGKDVGSQLGS